MTVHNTNFTASYVKLPKLIPKLGVQGKIETLNAHVSWSFKIWHNLQIILFVLINGNFCDRPYMPGKGAHFPLSLPRIMRCVVYKPLGIISLAWDCSVAIVLIKIMELWLVISDNYINMITWTSYEALLSDPVVIVSRSVL
jgi:hypothetical protein